MHDSTRGHGLAVTITDELYGDTPAESLFIQEVLRRGAREMVRSRWRIEEARIEPGMLDGVLPAGARVLFRNTDLSNRDQDVLLELKGCVVFLEREPTSMVARVAARSRSKAEATLRRLWKLLPSPVDEAEGTKVGMVFWHVGGRGPRSDHRSVAALEWRRVSPNYPAGTRARLAELMSSFEPGKGGRLILWHGEPGTGKTSAIRALAWEWREWGEVHCIVDPESLLGSEPSYLMQVLDGLSEEASFEDDEESPDGGGKWRLLVLEDTGELLSPDAKDRTGQGLSRLLNVADGLLGQGLRVLVLVTTNEPAGTLHPAVARPGRCAAEVKSDRFSRDEAAEWLGGQGSDEVTPPSGAVSLAELYAVLACGSFEARSAVGFRTH